MLFRSHFQKALPLLKDETAATAVQFKIADCFFGLGRLPESAGVLQQLIQTHPRAAVLDRAYFQLGEAYRRSTNSVAAGQAFAALVKNYPTSPLAPQAQYNLGLLLAGEHQESAARTAFSAVVSNFPVSVWASNAALAVGESFARDGRVAESRAEFDQLIQAGLDMDLAQQAFYSRGWVSPR